MTERPPPPPEQPSGERLDRECPGTIAARDALEKVGPPPRLMGHLELGAFTRKLSLETEDGVIELVRIMDMCMRCDASWLDAAPVVNTNWGKLVASAPTRCEQLERLAADPDGEGGQNGMLLRAAGQLEDLLYALEEAWLDRRLAIVQATRMAEHIAVQGLGTYLTRSKVLALEARDRYVVVADNGVAVPRPYSLDWRDLKASVLKLRKLYSEQGIEKLKSDKTFLSIVGSALIVSGTYAAWTGQALGVDTGDWDTVSSANRTLSYAERELAEAVYTYTMELRRLAQVHPLVLPLHRKGFGTDFRLAQEVPIAIDEAIEAIERLMQKGVNHRKVQYYTERGSHPSLTAIAEIVAAADIESVWKLPFFMDRALGSLPRQRAEDVRGIMELARRRKAERDMAKTMAIMGIDAAMTMAVFAGPVGMGMSVLWGLVHLAHSVGEYNSLQALFKATLDPSVMLRGSDHEEASKLGIAMDLLGLIP